MTITVLVTGNSNANFTFSDPESLFAFEAAVEQQTGDDVTIINAAVGGSSLTDVKDPNWTGSSETDPYALMLQEIAGREVDYIVFIGTESDAHRGVTAEGAYNGLSTFDARLEEDFGDARILVVPMLGGGVLDGTQVNEGLRQYTDVETGAILITPDFQAATVDGIHYDAATRAAIAEAIADEIVLPSVEVEKILIIGVNVTPEELPGYGFTQEQIDSMLS